MNRRRLNVLLMLACSLAVGAPRVHAALAYVSNEDGHSVTVIDTDSGETIATVPVGKRPRGLKLSRDESLLYVAVSGRPKCPPSVADEECASFERDMHADGIAVVDTASLRVLRLLNAGSDPEQFDLARDGSRLFVANEDAATLTVIDARSGHVVKRIPVGEEPEGVVVSPDGKWILVTNETDGSVSVVDSDKLAVTHTVSVGKRPRDVAFTGDGHAYVSGEFDASVYRLAVPAGDPIEKLIQLRPEARPMGIILDERRQRLYVSTGRGGTVAVIELTAAKPRLIADIAVGARPWGMAVSEDGRTLYTANGPSNDVAVVDLTTLKVTRRIKAGRSPWGIVVGESPRALAGQ